jgi:Holliday junction resolvase RusA-like endonuclease
MIESSTITSSVIPRITLTTPLRAEILFYTKRPKTHYKVAYRKIEEKISKKRKYRELLNTPAVSGHINTTPSNVLDVEQSTDDRDVNLTSSAPRWYTRNNDLDNMLKFVMDALNGIVYVDDSQIVEIISGKYYTHDESRIVCTFTEL